MATNVNRILSAPKVWAQAFNQIGQNTVRPCPNSSRHTLFFQGSKAHMTTALGHSYRPRRIALIKRNCRDYQYERGKIRSSGVPAVLGWLSPRGEMTLLDGFGVGSTCPVGRYEISPERQWIANSASATLTTVSSETQRID